MKSVEPEVCLVARPELDYDEMTGYLADVGGASGLVRTANVRTLRHVIEARTAAGAKEEIRLLFGKVGEVMRRAAPARFGDYVVEDGAWTPKWRKV